jgi:hypothetical protein
MSDYALTLSIAGLAVTLTTPLAALHAALLRRYQSYTLTSALVSALTHAVTPHLTLALEVEPPQVAAPTDRTLTFRPGAVDFISPYYRGTIDLIEHQGRLIITSQALEEDADYFVRTAYALLAFEAGGLLFHAAGLVRGARAFVFFGPSGSGKTTVARLSPQALLLNDDLVLLMPGARWQAHATPFSNASQQPPASPCSAPIALLLRLVQDQRTYLEPLSSSRQTAELIASAPLVAADPQRSSQLFDRALALAAAAPVVNLHFLPDASFWPLIEAHSDDYS